MAILNIRRLPARVHRWLRVRAATNGRSMEAEARKILTDLCNEQERVTSAGSVQEWVDALYGKRKPGNVVDDLIEERRREGKRE